MDRMSITQNQGLDEYFTPLCLLHLNAIGPIRNSDTIIQQFKRYQLKTNKAPHIP